jgi:hypothetical protein
MCWIKKGEGYNQGKAELLVFFNLMKVTEEVLRKGNCRRWMLELWNFSDNAKINKFWWLASKIFQHFCWQVETVGNKCRLSTAEMNQGHPHSRSFLMVTLCDTVFVVNEWNATSLVMSKSGSFKRSRVLLTRVSLVTTTWKYTSRSIKQFYFNIRTRHEWDCHSRENKRDRMGWDRARLDSNGIGFENTVDYCSWMVNEIHKYCSQVPFIWTEWDKSKTQSHLCLIRTVHTGDVAVACENASDSCR